MRLQTTVTVTVTGTDRQRAVAVPYMWFLARGEQRESHDQGNWMPAYLSRVAGLAPPWVTPHVSVRAFELE